MDDLNKNFEEVNEVEPGFIQPPVEVQAKPAGDEFIGGSAKASTASKPPENVDNKQPSITDTVQLSDVRALLEQQESNAAEKPFYKSDQTKIREITAKEQELLNTDPRDYIEMTAFQKAAQAITPDTPLPWNRADDALFVYREFPSDQAIAVANILTTENGERKWTLLFAQRNAAGETSAQTMGNLDWEKASLVEELISNAADYLPDNGRDEFVRSALELASDSSLARDQLGVRLYTNLLERLSDSSEYKPEELTKLAEFPTGASGVVTPTQEQVSQMRRFIELAGRKTSPEVFNERLANIFGSTKYAHDQYGKSYLDIYNSFLEKILADRRVRTDSTDISKHVKPFPVHELIRAEIGSPKELEDVLSQVPVESAPDLSWTTAANTAVEFVPLEKVVGCLSVKDWSFIERAGQEGISDTWKFVKGFQEGKNMIGAKSPIYVNELWGKYYITDGRHRTAALKGLKVPFAPMVVNHYSL